MSRCSPMDRHTTRELIDMNFMTFRECRWFHRGWTLQELLVLPSVEFYDKEWTFIGTKDCRLEL